MNTMPFFHLSSENNIMKCTLDETREEIFLVHADTLEVIYLNRTALEKRGSEGLGFPLNLARIGTEYNLKPFKELVQPLMNGNCTGISFYTQHRCAPDKTYPVDVRITRNTLQGLDYLLLTASDVTEKVQLEKRLRHQEEDLKKRGFEMDHFIHSASHDLMIPITLLKGFLLDHEKDLKQGSGMPYHDVIRMTLGMLDRYLHDLDDFLKNMHRQVTAEKVDFEHVMQQVHELLALRDGFSGADTRVSVNQGMPFYSDKERIPVLLKHLFVYALQYRNLMDATASLRVSIRVGTKSASIQFLIQSHAAATDPVNGHEHEAFEAAVPDQGSGLSRYVAREILKKLKGKIWVTGVPGQGAEIFIEIPNKSPRAAVHKDVNRNKPSKPER